MFWMEDCCAGVFIAEHILFNLNLSQQRVLIWGYLQSKTHNVDWSTTYFGVISASASLIHTICLWVPRYLWYAYAIPPAYLDVKNRYPLPLISSAYELLQGVIIIFISEMLAIWSGSGRWMEDSLQYHLVVITSLCQCCLALHMPQQSFALL